MTLTLFLLLFCFGCGEVDTKSKIESGVTIRTLSFRLAPNVTAYGEFSVDLNETEIKAIQRAFSHSPRHFSCVTAHVGVSSLEYVAEFSDGTSCRKALIFRFFADAVFAQFETSSDSGFQGMNSITLRLDECVDEKIIQRISNHFKVDEELLSPWPGNLDFPAKTK